MTLHGLLTRHVASACAWYRCRTAVHTASTLLVQHRPHLELEFGLRSETNITGRQSCGKLHRVQDLRKEATADVGVYIQLLLGVANEACGSHQHCLVLALNG